MNKLHWKTSTQGILLGIILGIMSMFLINNIQETLKYQQFEKDRQEVETQYLTTTLEDLNENKPEKVEKTKEIENKIAENKAVLENTEKVNYDVEDTDYNWAFDGIDQSEELTEEEKETLIFDYTSSIKTIGTIKIPDISLELPIFDGIYTPLTEFDEQIDTMLFGAVTNLRGQEMGKDNYVLASHKTGKRNTLFSEIYRLENGSKIYLDNGSNTYTYTVFDNFTINGKDLWILNNVKIDGKRADILTLYTCTSIRSDDDGRTVIRALLTDIK